MTPIQPSFNVEVADSTVRISKSTLDAAREVARYREPTPACFGVGCRLRARCARYAVAVTQADGDTLPTCVDGDRFPLFLDLTAARLATPAGPSAGHSGVRAPVRGAATADRALHARVTSMVMSHRW